MASFSQINKIKNPRNKARGARPRAFPLHSRETVRRLHFPCEALGARRRGCDVGAEAREEREKDSIGKGNRSKKLTRIRRRRRKKRNETQQIRALSFARRPPEGGLRADTGGGVQLRGARWLRQPRGEEPNEKERKKKKKRK